MGFVIPNGLVLALPVGPPIETLTVSAEYYANLASSTIFAKGETYYILAEGTYRHAYAGQRCDAEWKQVDPGGNWIEQYYPGEYEHDLLINDTSYNWWGSALTAPNPVLDYQTYDPHVFSDQHHTYWLPFVGEGAPIRLSILDSCYDDNLGSLTVSIYTPEPATFSLLALGGLAIMRRRRRSTVR